MKKLWVDDVRAPFFQAEKWDIAKSYNEAIQLLFKNSYDVISLAHDLGEGQNGMDILKWMYNNSIWPKTIHVHSANPVAAERMQAFIDDVEKELNLV